MYYYDFEKGFLKYDDIKNSGLLILDFDNEETCVDGKMTWFTYTDLKKILNIYLTDDERKNAVQAFEKVKNGRGYVPLYCFESILRNRKGNK